MFMQCCLAWAAILAGAAPAPAEPALLAKVRQAHERMIRELETVVLAERVSIDGAARPAADEETRSDLTASIRDSIAKLQQSGNVSDEQIERTVATLLDELGRVDAAVRVTQLNRRACVERTASIDFRNRRMVEQDRDLRDVAALVRENQLGPPDAAMLDQTVTRILDAGRSIELFPNADRLAFVAGPVNFNADGLLPRLGILPSWVFESGLDLEVDTRIPGIAQELRLIGRKDGVMRVAADLREEYGYRLIRLRLYTADGALLQDTLLTGFHEIEGRWAPSEFSVRVVGPTDRDELRFEQHQIRRISFNVEIPPAAFQIPGGYRLQSVGP